MSGEVSIHTTETFSDLDNKNAKREDSALYTVTLKNPAGTTSASATVTVTDKPSPPEGPLQVSDVTSDSVTLTWKQPKDDGGSPLV